MDTRAKILTVEAAAARLAGTPATLVVGRFDVLRASHVRELRQIEGKPLVAVVRPMAEGILPQRARAELAAALRMIDYVVTADDRDLDTLVSSLPNAPVVHLDDSDRARARDLKQHVQRRQSS